MGKKSTIDKFPPDVRDYLERCIANSALTQEEISDEVNDYLVERGLKPVMTRRILGRYNDTQKKAKEDLKRHQEVTKEIVKQYGGISLAEMGKGIAALVDGLVVNTIKNWIKMIWDLKRLKI